MLSSPEAAQSSEAAISSAQAWRIDKVAHWQRGTEFQILVLFNPYKMDLKTEAAQNTATPNSPLFYSQDYVYIELLYSTG